MSILNDKEITSVDDGTQNPFPTRVDAPPPPKAEQLKHTGAHNIIDPQIYDQNVKIRSLTWSVTDERGKLLAKIPVHPENMGEFTKYIQPMYHYWSGGMCIELRIMGTAYQAGQLVLVEIPPDADVEAIALSGDYTGYNWVALDVKDPALIHMHVRDVNQGTFHYVKKINNFDPLNIGSWFALIVDSPLNSTTGGTQQVGVEIWAKPSREFQFSRLRIPRPSQITSVIAPQEITYALNFSGHNFPDRCCNVKAVAYRAVVLPNSVKVSTNSQAGMRDLSGNLLNSTEVYWPYLMLKKSEISEWTASTSSCTCPYQNNYYNMYDVEVSCTFYIGAKWYGCSVTLSEATPGGTAKITIPEDNYNRLKQASGFLYMNNVNSFDGAENLVVTTPGFKLPVDESFLMFGYGQHLYAHQTELLSRVFASKAAKGWLPTNSCASFMMIDAVEQIPIGLVKLWEEGFFTIKASKDQKEYVMANLNFVFKGFVPRTQRLQTDPALSQGRMLVESAHRRILSSRKRDPKVIE